MKKLAFGASFYYEGCTGESSFQAPSGGKIHLALRERRIDATLSASRAGGTGANVDALSPVPK